MNADKSNARILLVEDDKNLSLVIKDYLILADYDITLCDNGESAWETFKNHSFDLCILDVMLPKLDGFTLGEMIRHQNESVPILFLTAKSAKEDKIRGFKIGADDYIVKPFNIEELVLRIEVFLKRTRIEPVLKEKFAIGMYSFDYLNLSLIHQEVSHKLTQREADVLKILSVHIEQVVKREDILMQVWGEDDYFLGRSLDVFISKLRRYLNKDMNVRIINYHAVGFRLTVITP